MSTSGLSMAIAGWSLDIYNRISMRTSGGKLPCASIVFDIKTRTNYKYLSNSYAGSPIVSVQGTQIYATADHYYETFKAAFVGDDEACVEIMNAKTASDAKKIGESLEISNNREWEEYMQKAMFTVLCAKFSPASDVKDELLGTGQKLLVYSGEKDLVWATGLNTKRTKSRTVASWPGKNLLGEMLMQVH
ncbi:hypothetical protein EAE99_007478 [Botrytis elliptica]|nr:hypothetical protein EAE99_007478 [Botrytis elliptica]